MREFQELQQRTKSFALRILKVCRSLPKTDEGRILAKQILRSGTSVGANYRAACRARSRPEFVSKLGIVLEEADETVFWLELIQEADIFPGQKLESLILEANELVAIFVASVCTAKGSTSSM